MLSVSTRLPVCGALPAPAGVAVNPGLAMLALRIFDFEFAAIFYISCWISTRSRRLF
jgi:hypothetical protein